MKKPVIALLIFLLVAAISNMVLVSARSASNPPVLPQPVSSSQLAHTVKSSSLPSPFIVALWIVGLVAVFGALLSLFLRGRRHASQADAKRVGERFWAIDFSGVFWFAAAS